MRPQRLLRAVPEAQRAIIAMAATAAAGGLVIVWQADQLAGILATATTRAPAPARLAGPLAVLAAIIAIRVAVMGLHAEAAARGAAGIKAGLRSRLLRRLGEQAGAAPPAGETAVLLSRGLDALDPYLTGYLPQLVLAAVVPLAVIARLALADWVSTVIVVLTLPLIPVFGILVGKSTGAAVARQWGTLSRLGDHFLDVIAGLPTLRCFDRARAQAQTVRRLADAHRRATMRTLRIAFLSALILELVAAFSVALIAVPLGLRLLDGQVTLRVGLLVLLLAPEAYLPLRALGSRFHASAEALTVAGQAFALIDRPPPGPVPAAPPGGAGLRLDAIVVRYPGRPRPALDKVTLALAAGERVALVGPSGAGKTTLLKVALGLVTPDEGGVGRDGARPGPGDFAWVPQHPHLFAATIAGNIRLGQPGASDAAVRAAAAAAGADAFIAALPGGYQARLGERGQGLSAGQRQRIGIARAFLRDAPVLLLDEPTAHLDAATEEAVLAATVRLMAGRTTLIVAHRPAVLRYVDRVVALRDGQLVAPGQAPRSEALADRGDGGRPREMARTRPTSASEEDA
jgi:ATP-binding cassette subfamily C protein CydD